MDEKKLKSWEKIFKKTNEDQDSSRRIQVLVLDGINIF